MNNIIENIKNISTDPGVYFFKDKKNNILYIGKAKNLRKRVSSYFTKSNKDIKNKLMISKAFDIDTIVVNNEVEALITEANLIKIHKPRYNVFLKDDKGHLYEHKIEKVIYSFKKNRVKFFEINSIDDADKLRGLLINIRRTDLPKLKNKEYYLNDLIGYSLIDKSNNSYGDVINVLHFPANNVLTIFWNEKEYLIPIRDDIILDVSHNSKQIIINPISGLFNQ